MTQRRRATRNRSRRPKSALRRGALIIGLLVLIFMVGERTGLVSLFIERDQTELTDPQASSPADSGADFQGRVTRIVDGDTFWISGQDVRIRVWGLDAPETSDPDGAAATAAMTRLVSDQVLQCRQRDIDRFGRIVGQCFLPDGRDITREMINSGTAREYCHFSRNYYGTC